MAREVEHDWSVPWVEDDALSDDTMVNTAMAHLHGFDVVSRDPDRPSVLHHGPPGVYYRTLEQVQQDLDHWRRECSMFDQDPAAWRAERLALARAAVEAESRRGRDDLISVDLTDEERRLLVAALLQWIGPARPTKDMVLAMGFGQLDSFGQDTTGLRRALERRDPLSRRDWQKILIATEIVFASDVVGAGLDWPIVTGFRDDQTIALLRGLQRKMPRWRKSRQFDVDEGAVDVDDGSVTIRDPERHP